MAAPVFCVGRVSMGAGSCFDVDRSWETGCCRIKTFRNWVPGRARLTPRSTDWGPGPGLGPPPPWGGGGCFCQRNATHSNPSSLALMQQNVAGVPQQGLGQAGGRIRGFKGVGNHLNGCLCDHKVRVPVREAGREVARRQAPMRQRGGWAVQHEGVPTEADVPSGGWGSSHCARRGGGAKREMCQLFGRQSRSGGTRRSITRQLSPLFTCKKNTIPLFT